MTTTTYTVTGMICGNCENHVRQEVAQIEGVTDILVSHASGQLTVSTAGDPVDDAAVLSAVDEAGYTAARTS